MRLPPTNTASRRLLLALLSSLSVASLLLTGCGETQNDDASGKRLGASAPTHRAADPISTSSAAPRPLQQPLTKSTLRPPDVSAQFEYIGGAGPGPCLAVHSPPAVDVYVQPFPSTPASTNSQVGADQPTRVSFGQSMDVCFNGFGLGPAQVSLTGPRGFHQAGTLASHAPDECPRGECSDGWDWIPAVDESWPLGQYRISAHTATGRASTTFSVVSTSTPGIRVLGPSTDPGHNEIAPDSQARVFLTGFRSAKSVLLAVYRLNGASGEAAFFSATSVPLSSAGRAIVMLSTGHEAGDTTFLLTVKYRGVMYFAPLSVTKPYTAPTLIVGPLPAS